MISMGDGGGGGAGKMWSEGTTYEGRIPQACMTKRQGIPKT